MARSRFKTPIEPMDLENVRADGVWSLCHLTGRMSTRAR